jgi:3-methyladenine DNA glycosylase AlkD
MKKTQALAKLESLGTAQNRKIYGRHGVTREMYGVSYANLGKLVKEIKVDHALALDLWASGNHDARVLATMVADPDAIDAKTLNAWAKALDSYVIADAFSKLAAQSPVGRKRTETWVRSKDEWIGTAGWNVVAQVADGLPEATCRELLTTIESGIHKAKNRARYSMNNALISIGARGGALQKAAVAAAKRIGPVEVDHGETGCKTPDAAAYIKKTLEYRERRKK